MSPAQTGALQSYQKKTTDDVVIRFHESCPWIDDVK